MRDYLPAIFTVHKGYYELSGGQPGYTGMNLSNCVPNITNDGVAANIRSKYTRFTYFSGSSADRGRGIASFGGINILYIVNDTYYYDSGNQDLQSTSAPGYAANTGFNEEYGATFTQHKVSGVENLVIVNAGHTSISASAKHGNIWYQDLPANAPSSVSSANLPCNLGSGNEVSITRGGVSLDGYFFICDIRGRIYNSNLNDITTWAAADFLTASREPDIGIYIGHHHDNVVYIGTKSVEFFYNAGNPTGSPLSVRRDVHYSVGCWYPNAIAEIGDIIYFVGTDHNGWSRIYKLENWQLTAISTTAIETKLRPISGGINPDITTGIDSIVDDVWITPIMLYDSPGIILTYDNDWSYVWHEKTNLWNPWSLGLNPVTYKGGASSTDWSNVFPIVGFNHESAKGNASLYQLTNGTILQESSSPSDTDALSDTIQASGNGTADVYINFNRWDGGTQKKKRINWVRIDAEPPASTHADHVNFACDVRWLDYKTAATAAPAAPTNYSTGRSVTLNTTPEELNRMGVCRQRTFLLHFTGGYGEVGYVKGIEIDYDIVE